MIANERWQRLQWIGIDVTTDNNKSIITFLGDGWRDFISEWKWRTFASHDTWSRNYIPSGWNMGGYKLAWNSCANYICITSIVSVVWDIECDRQMDSVVWLMARQNYRKLLDQTNLRTYFHLEKKRSSLSRDLRFQNYTFPDHTFVILRSHYDRINYLLILAVCIEPSSSRWK